MTEPRAAAAPEPARLSDLLWLGLTLALLIGTGLGVRDPWPADEPRFALLARDMVHTGEWLFPRIAGDLYPEKPPVFLWLLSVCYWLTGSLKASFLIPSFVSACAVVGLVYDIGRRIAGRASGLAAGLTLACCVQFVMTMRGAQIDPVLCAFTTLSLYGFLRHLLFGPAWGWCFVGGLFAGIGTVTKGVGFLPLLVLLPYAVFRARRFNSLPAFEGGVRWGLVPLGFLLGVSVWLVPMLIAVAVRNDPALVAYRDALLFQQTVQRYASAWHHLKPWYFFLHEIPGLWLPLSPLIIWLVPQWRRAWLERDARVWLPLAWVVLTLLFFSLSAGKRGIYIFPALPALAIAAAPFLPELFKRPSIRRGSLLLAAWLLAGAAALLIVDAVAPELLRPKLTYLGVDSLVPIGIFTAVAAVVWGWALVKNNLVAWPALLAVLAVVWSYGITPNMDGERSARDFTRYTLSLVPRDTELALLAYKAQFVINLDRPIVNFGHGRWREGKQEDYDAAAWLSAAPGRVVLVPESGMKPCFVSTSNHLVGRSSGDRWYLVRGQASPECVAKGDASRAIRYEPPVFAGS